jgi:hypothetical protein
MKLVVFAILVLAAALHAAVPSQTVERWQAAAVLKYPALKEPGSPLNKQFLAVVAAKRQSEPAFFNQPDWPLRAADLAVQEIQNAEAAAKQKAIADEQAAKAKAKAEAEKTKAEIAARRDMTPEERREMDRKDAKAEMDRMNAEEIAQWDTQKDKWVFDRLVLGDEEDVIIRKLNLSKLVTPRVPPSSRIELNSRFRWEIGERKYNLDFEMKDGKLAAINFGCLSEKTTELDTLVKEDWDKLRAAAIERFGPPTTSNEFPTAKTLKRSGLTVTDVWQKPGSASAVTLGVAEEESRCNPALRIGAPVVAPAK